MPDLIAELKARDPARRREAIIALGKAGDASVIDILNRVAATDPDQSLRSLSAQAAAHLQRDQWRRAQQGKQPVLLPHEMEPSDTALRQREMRRISQARSNLDLAMRYHTAKEYDKALDVLAQAVQGDRQLAQDKQARLLASQLLKIADPAQAMNDLLARIEAAQHERNRPKIDIEGLQTTLIALGTALALLLVLMVFYRMVTKDLVSIVSLGITQARLNAVFRALNPSLIAQAFISGLLLFVAISVGNFVMYWLGGVWLSGSVEMSRFAGGLMTAQALTIGLGLVCLAFMPVTTVVPINGPNGPTNAVAVNTLVIAFGFFWTVLLQSYIVSKLQGVPLLKATIVVLVGIVVFYGMAQLIINLALKGVK